MRKEKATCQQRDSNTTNAKKQKQTKKNTRKTRTHTHTYTGAKHTNNGKQTKLQARTHTHTHTYIHTRHKYKSLESRTVRYVRFDGPAELVVADVVDREIEVDVVVGPVQERDDDSWQTRNNKRYEKK